MKNNIALVLGNGRDGNNVGCGITRKLKDEGWVVIGADINDYAEEYSDYFYNVDLREKREVEELFDYIENNFVSLDLVVNSAGVNKMGNLGNYTEDMWDDTIDVNLKSQFLVLQQYFKRYNDKDYKKRFLAITSHTGMIPKSNTFAYGASKAGANHFIRCAARELNKYHGQDEWYVAGFAAGMIENTPMDTDIKKQLIEDMDNVENMEDAHAILTKNIPTYRGLTIDEVAEWVYFMITKGTYSTGNVLAIDSGQLQG